MGRNGWTKGLRRAVAFFMATVTVWVLTLTADLPAAAETVRTLGESPAFVAAVLAAELDCSGEDESALLGRWGSLAVEQSPLLSAGMGQVEKMLDRKEQDSATSMEPDDPEDPQQLPEATSAPDDIRPQTLSHAEGDLSVEDISVNNTTGQTIDVAALASAAVEIELGDGPQILIMHTHGSEAYTMDGTDIYTPSDTYRTTDNSFNVVRVGTEIADVLTEMGFSVIHDTTLYDHPAYSGAYGRSKEAVERYLEQYPTIKVVLDVHRDALIGADGTTYKTMANVGGEEMAQVMLVVGSDDAGASHPEWKKNLTFAIKLQQKMNEIDTTLSRPITVRTDRFNQQLTTGSVLVEVGSHGNTLREALAAARLFALAAGEELKTLLPTQ